MPITFTIITSTSCALAKTFTRNAAGDIESSAIAHMTAGHARVVAVNSVSDFAANLDLLEPNEAITLGVPAHGNTPLTTRAAQHWNPDAVARTNESFVWPTAPAFFAIDVDIDDDRFRTVESVLDALESCSPWLRDAHRIARPSSSSFVGARGLRGVHAYFGVTNGDDIPALAKRLHYEQWLNGKGTIKISKSGALLVRQLSDALVYQPSRLMFEASPVLDGVERAIPASQVLVERTPDLLTGRPSAHRIDGLIDVRAMKPLKGIDERRAETMQKAAKNSRRQEAKKVALDYQIARAIDSGYDAAHGERFGHMANRIFGDEQHRLPLAWEIATQKYGRLTVADLLSNPACALGLACADPFDAWRTDLTDAHFSKAQIVEMAGELGVWSHKGQCFYPFDPKGDADFSTPLEVAAERIAGCIEWPEKQPGTKASPAANVKYALKLLLDEAGIALRKNESTYEIETAGLPSLSALMDALTYVGVRGVTGASIEAAIQVLVTANSYDPWRATVLNLPKWDGVPRLDTFFPDICGALNSEALTATGQLLFAAIVMRQLHPGADMQVVPVLIGQGGTGKTHFVKTLAASMDFPPPPPLHFTEHIRMSMTARTSAIVELAELSGMGKREVEEIKAWISAGTDTYRDPYAKADSRHPRRFVLLGTSNKHETNIDPTGQRRLMPVHLNMPIDSAWAVEARQLFAEAKERFVDPAGEYDRLHSRTIKLVYAYNEADMRRGVGTVASDLDDLMPPILARALRDTDDRKVPSRAIRTALDATPQGRLAHARVYAAWLTTRGWKAVHTMKGTAYLAPQEFIDDMESSDIELPLTHSPFAQPQPVTTH